MAGSLFLSLTIKEQGWRGGVVYVAWQIELIFCHRFHLQAKQDEERLIKNRQITKDVKTTYVRFFLSLR